VGGTVRQPPRRQVLDFARDDMKTN